ncbi:MAG: DNA alkylation repair protein [Bacteriovoracales bacterium]|nr:DNA alkylation repair protein [Bacteriovoracales bacterium]
MFTYLTRSLNDLADPRYAVEVKRFFKTGKGDYGEGDIFLGIRTPLLRKLAKNHLSLPLRELKWLLRSKIHEERLFALIVLVEKYKCEEKFENESKKRALYLLYCRHFRFINNWDLVDISAPHIVGRYLADKDKGILLDWAKSSHLWTRRIAVVANWWFIRNGDLGMIFKVAKLLLDDPHDLIHKAVGWMLREAAKKDRKKAMAFLERHHRKMPRVMLRYAIERYPSSLRKKFLIFFG